MDDGSVGGAWVWWVGKVVGVRLCQVGHVVREVGKVDDVS